MTEFDFHSRPHRAALGEGECEVLRPHHRTRASGGPGRAGADISDLDVDFPHAVQAAKIVRHRTQRKTGRRSRETVYVITDLTSRQASPERIAKIVRSQWITENRLHFVRDTTFAEDASKVRTGHGPDNMATLRSFAINTLRAEGHTNIAAGLREMSYGSFHRPLDLIGLP
nr:transposase [Streptomyces sp. NBC_00830]